LEYVRGVDDNGCVSYTPVTSFALNVQDTNTLDLTFANGIISGNVRISGTSGNQIQVLPDGLFVSSISINVQDTPTVDLTLTPTNDLSANVNVSTQAGNAIQVLSDGLFVGQINVQDTPTVDLTLTPTNDLSADVNVSAQAGNAVQVLPDGLFVAQLNVQDTPTIDITLTATNDLSADVNVSSQPGNAIQVLSDGLFVSSNSINVQDTPTVDLTLTATNDLIANVNVSAQAGNGLQVLSDGLYIPSTSNPCLSNPPNLISLPNDNLLVTYNANTGCLEQITIPSERVVYGEPSGNGSPRTDNLLYSPSNNFLRATVGPDFPMQNSFVIYGQNVNVSNVFYSLIGSLSNSNIGIGSFSILNLDSANNLICYNSVLVGIGLTLDVGRDIYGSAILFRNLSIRGADYSFISAINSSADNEIIGSFIFALNSSLQNTFGSFISAAFNSSIGGTSGSFIVASRSSLQGNYHSFVNAINVNYIGTVTCSLSIALASTPSANQPFLQYSTHISRNTYVISGSPAIIYSNAILNSVNIIGNLHIYQSTVHLENVTLSFDNSLSNRQYLLSFISARNSSLGRTEYSFFSGDINANQTPRILWSLVSTRPNDFNRNGPAIPEVRSSLVITANNLPYSINSLLISNSSNTWLELYRSVCVADNIQVFDNNPPNNTAILSNSLIVGQGHNVSSIANINSLALVGSNLSAGTQTVFGVGINAYAPPAVINAGGWRAYIADGGADNANYFQGWASAWRFRMFRPSNNYANDAAAVTALNTAYGADPRNAVGTMVVALVNGNPAIFTWNGTTFVRITV
jgi:transcriptional regulator